MAAEITQAVPADVPQVTALWNTIIRETVITFNPVEKSEAEVAGFIAGRLAEGHPFLVARRGGEVLGYATYGQFRPGAGNARVMEHSINLAPAAQGLGLGRRLMGLIEDHARARALRSMIAAISADNAGSLRFHAALGYAEVGRIPDMGWKFGRYHDLVLMQKLL